MATEQKKIFAGLVFILLVTTFFAVSLNLSKIRQGALQKKYTVYADFNRISSLREGDNVYISGILKGKVVDLSLNDDYSVKAKLELDTDFKLPEDSTFSIQTDGLIGGKFIEIAVGGDDENVIESGGNALFTQDSIELDELVEQILAMARRKNEKDKTK